MHAYRCVDPARHIVLFHQQPVECFAHSVQTLKFECFMWFCKFEDSTGGMCIVCRKLRVDMIRSIKQLLRAVEVRDVGYHFPRIHRIVIHSHCLGLFDLKVPIGAFHQSDGYAPVQCCSQCRQPFYDQRRLFQICLHDHTESIPSAQFRFAQYRFNHIQRQLQSICLLGIDGKSDSGGAGSLSQCLQTRYQLIHNPMALHIFVTRMQCRKFYRNARIGLNIRRSFPNGQSGDGMVICLKIFVGILRGSCRLSEHVERITIGSVRLLFRLLDRLSDTPAKNKLLSQNFHRLVNGFLRQSFTQSCHRLQHQLRHRQLIRLPLFEHAAGKHQRPGRCTHKK